MISFHISCMQSCLKSFNNWWWIVKTRARSCRNFEDSTPNIFWWTVAILQNHTHIVFLLWIIIYHLLTSLLTLMKFGCNGVKSLQNAGTMLWTSLGVFMIYVTVPLSILDKHKRQTSSLKQSVIISLRLWLVHWYDNAN